MNLSKPSYFVLSLFELTFKHFDLLTLTLQHLIYLDIVLPIERRVGLAHWHSTVVVAWELHWHLVGIQSIKLANLKLLLRLNGGYCELRSRRVLVWSHGRHWRFIKRICVGLAPYLWLISLFCIILGLPILYTLVKRGLIIFLNVDFLGDLTRPLLAIAIIWLIVVSDGDMGLLIALLIVYYRSGLYGILWVGGLLFEIILFVYILDDLFILTLHVLYLFLQVLELQMQGFYLLVTPDVPGIANWLCNLWVGWRI